MRVTLLIDAELTLLLSDLQAGFMTENTSATIRRAIRECHKALKNPPVPVIVPTPTVIPASPCTSRGRPPTTSLIVAKLEAMSDARLTAYFQAIGRFPPDGPYDKDPKLAVQTHRIVTDRTADSPGRWHFKILTLKENGAEYYWDSCHKLSELIADCQKKKLLADPDTLVGI